VGITDLQPAKAAIFIAVAGAAFLVGRVSVERTDQTQVSVELDPVVASDLDPAVPVFYRPRRNLVCRDPTHIALVFKMLSGIEDRDPAKLEEARSQLIELQRTASVGSEVYTYLWLTEFLLAAPGAERDLLLKNPNGARMVRFFGGQDLPTLPAYLRMEHGLVEVENRDDFRHIDEVVRFMSPSRDSWEQTDEVIEAMGVKHGQHITDLGAGPGYFTWRFAEAVGPEGQVHAVELNLEHLSYLTTVVADEGLSQVTVHPTDGSSIGAEPGSMDHVFMCSTFQSIYANLKATTRVGLIEEIRNSLKPGGRLTVMEKFMNPQGVAPARGTLMARQVVVAYLEASGFRLVASHTFVPQRYTLIFEPT